MLSSAHRKEVTTHGKEAQEGCKEDSKAEDHKEAQGDQEAPRLINRTSTYEV